MATNADPQDTQNFSQKLWLLFTTGSFAGTRAQAVVRMASDGSIAPDGSAASPMFVNTGGGIPSAAVITQVKLTGVAQQLPALAVANSIDVWGKETNTGKFWVGTSNAVTATDDGTGNGAGYLPGFGDTFRISNSNELWVIGTANDVVYIAGS